MKLKQKLKQKLLLLGVGIGLTLPSMLALAGGYCQRCEEAMAACELAGYSHNDCLFNIVKCRLC